MGSRVRVLWKQVAAGWEHLQPFYTLVAWGQFTLLTGYATYLLLTPSPGSVFVSVWDKLLHVICWFVLTVSLRIAWQSASFPPRAALVLFAYSLILEVLQHFVPERAFDARDLLGNAAGIALAYLLARLLGLLAAKLRSRLPG